VRWRKLGTSGSRKRIIGHRRREKELYRTYGLVVQDVKAWSCGESVRSRAIIVNSAKLRLLVFPGGTCNSGGGCGGHVSAFVELVDEDTECRVSYRITLINILDVHFSIVKGETFTLSNGVRDRGWHDFIRTSALTQEGGWLGTNDSLVFRASLHR